MTTSSIYTYLYPLTVDSEKKRIIIVITILIHVSLVIKH